MLQSVSLDGFWWSNTLVVCIHSYTYNIFHIMTCVTVTFVSDCIKQFPLLRSLVDIVIKSTGCVVYNGVFRIECWVLMLYNTLLCRYAYVCSASSNLHGECKECY